MFNKYNFEIIKKDFYGRIGKLNTNHGTIETPIFLPVINPHDQIISPLEMKNFNVNMIITNSYIIYSDKKLREELIEKGLHNYFNFNGPIMTDSGSYQLSVYGNININNSEIIKFQNLIDSDICVPLDIPTKPYQSYEHAYNDLIITNQRIKEAEKLYETNNYNSILACPIQGSTHLELREKSSLFNSNIDCGLYPIGAVVPLMESYKYEDIVNIIISSKKHLNLTKPVHLFGAGHPSMFSLAVLLGCDIFDSASYVLYAKSDRYITSTKTYKLNNLKYLPCTCPICTSYTLNEIKESTNKTKLLSMHNLYVILNEIKIIKQCIFEGSLFELVEQRCHSHPKLIDGFKNINKYSKLIELIDPSSKSTFKSFGSYSSMRPEIIKYNNRLNRFNFKNVKNALIRTSCFIHDSKFDQLLNFKPPIGAYPIELEETYPFNLEVPNTPSYQELKCGILNTIKLINLNKHIKFSFVIEKNISDNILFNDLLVLLEKYCNLIYEKDYLFS